MLCSLKAERPEGTVDWLESSIEYTLGSDALGPVGEAVDEALTGMTKQEVAQMAQKITLMMTRRQMGPYAIIYFLRPGGAWVDVPSELGLEALAPGRGRS